MQIAKIREGEKKQEKNHLIIVIIVPRLRIESTFCSTLRGLDCRSLKKSTGRRALLLKSPCPQWTPSDGPYLMDPPHTKG